MKKWIKRIGLVILGLLLIVAGFAAFIQFNGLPTFEPILKDLKVEVTPDRVAKGAKIAAVQCMNCHMGKDNRLSGMHMLDVPAEFGTIYSKNITQDKEKGIGNWTDGEIYVFLRTGIRKDGSYAPPYMPKFPLLADEDIYSIIAWLHSDAAPVQPSQKEPPPTIPNFLVKILSRSVMGPPPFPDHPIPLPDTNDIMASGRYYAVAAYDCYNCHSADFKSNSSLEPEKSVGFFGGGNPMLNLEGETVYSANITPDPDHGIGKWTEEQFLQAVKYGIKPDGTRLRYPMLTHTVLPDKEIQAIYAYLRTVPPLQNEVKR
ncbi:MAG: cytochrome c [Saprospiraceae bacterium]|nr:cytochrome c [Saprospiraceae bacterium]